MVALGRRQRGGPRGKRALVELFDKFGLQIQLDFRDFWCGLDVLEYFEGSRSWLEFYEFLNGLPAHSRFKAAVALDPELAQMLKDQRDAAEAEDDDEDELDEGDQAWNPKMRSQEGYSPEISLMYSMLDAMNEVSRTLIAVNGKRPPPKQKLPKPISAMDLLDLADERDEMHDLADRFGIRRT